MNNPTILNFLTIFTNAVNWADDWNYNILQLIGNLKTFAITMPVVGDRSSPYTIHIQLQNAIGNNFSDYAIVRVRVADLVSYIPSAFVSIAAASGTTLIETISSGNDLILKSNSTGLISITLTNARADGFRVLIGDTVLSPQFANYHNDFSFIGFPLENMSNDILYNMAGQTLYHE